MLALALALAAGSSFCCLPFLFFFLFFGYAGAGVEPDGFSIPMTWWSETLSPSSKWCILSCGKLILALWTI
jgi:hypothetical protein